MKTKLLLIAFLASMYLVNCTSINDVSGPQQGETFQGLFYSKHNTVEIQFFNDGSFQFFNGEGVSTTEDGIYTIKDGKITFTYLDYYLEWEENTQVKDFKKSGLYLLIDDVIYQPRILK